MCVAVSSLAGFAEPKRMSLQANLFWYKRGLRWKMCWDLLILFISFVFLLSITGGLNFDERNMMH